MDSGAAGRTKTRCALASCRTSSGIVASIIPARSTFGPCPHKTAKFVPQGNYSQVETSIVRLRRHPFFEGTMRRPRYANLVEKATHAAVAAIEIYNKPGFRYRASSIHDRRQTPPRGHWQARQSLPSAADDPRCSFRCHAVGQARRSPFRMAERACGEARLQSNDCRARQQDGKNCLGIAHAK